MDTNADFERRYFSGRELYGDDFSQAEIDEWFESEREGYADLGTGAGHGGGDTYEYHGLNQWHGFRHLPKGRFGHALGVGSAYGQEFEPIASKIDRLTILEPSDQLVGSGFGHLVPEYVKPDPSGTMAFEDGTFDLVVCFGTLHHIPNVTHVVSEIGRVTKPGGFALIREPIVSMGDWRKYRGPGTTQRERGIPLGIMRDAIRDAGLTIRHTGYSGFPLTVRVGMRLGIEAFNRMPTVIADAAMARATLPMYSYHTNSKIRKFRPTQAFFVAQR